MMTMTARARILFIVAALLLSLPLAAREISLDQWFDIELIPAVNEKLLTHPRFKGETIMFVVIDDNAPTPVSNELALSLRDRMLNAALDTEGVRVGWRQGSANPDSSGPVDCTRNSVHYYIGIELSRGLDRRYDVRVRAMDLEDRSWVGGFGSTWRGNLSATQQRALQNLQVDQTFLGARDVPFTRSQTDLLARHLAHELSCALSGQTNGEYVVPLPGDAGDDVLAGTLNLVSNNIASHGAVSISPDAASGNAVLTGQAHAINRSLHQYWLTITPNSPNAGLETLSVSAYVVLADEELNAAASDGGTATIVAARSTTQQPATVSIPSAAGNPVIGPLRVVTPDDDRHCGTEGRFMPASSRWSGHRRCSLLEAKAHLDTIVFVLQHQPQFGLVRLGDADCRSRTTARLVRSGDPMRFPIAWIRSDTGELRHTHQWLLAPTADTFYAIAISDARAARQLANHIDNLPTRCGTSLRPGLTGEPLQTWFTEFAALAARSAESIDWRAIELKDVL